MRHMGVSLMQWSPRVTQRQSNENIVQSFGILKSSSTEKNRGLMPKSCNGALKVGRRQQPVSTAQFVQKKREISQVRVPSSTVWCDPMGSAQHVSQNADGWSSVFVAGLVRLSNISGNLGLDHVVQASLASFASKCLAWQDFSDER